MKNIKKITAYILIGSMVMVLSACNSKPAPKTTPSSANAEVSSSNASTSKAGTETTTVTTTTSTMTTAEATTTTSEATTTTSEATTVGITTPTRKIDGDKIFYRDLDLMKTDGTTDKLSTLAKKYTVVCFWQTGYPICLDQLTVLEALAADEAEIVSVVMINTGETKETVEAFAGERSSNLTFYLDEDGSIAVDNQVTKLPYMMFLTEELEVMGTIGGKLNRADFNLIFDKIDEFRANRGE